MIDIHTHILPGVDDGVRDEDEAVEFARVAAADGVRTMIATPHCKDGFYVNTRESVLSAVERMRERLRAASIPLELLPGAEVHLGPDLLARIRDGRAPTLADNGRTLLLELSLSQYPVDLENLVFQLRLGGIVTVLAHPERIRFFQEDVKRFESVVRLGAFGQITTGSILGTFGEEAREFSELLLRRRLVHVLASDSHNLRGRPPLLSEALRKVASLVGEEQARAMVDASPRALIEGREPAVAPPVEEVARKGSWISRLLRRG